MICRDTFLDTETVAYEWTFPYSDEFFRLPSDKFSMKTAQASLGLALSAFRSSAGTVDPQYETYLTGAGFENLYSFGYDEPTTTDSLSGVIGMKQIDGDTLIAAVTCGQGYGKEWAGNLKVGTGVRHQGFDEASELLREHIDTYINENNIEGDKKIWLAGISRAGAVANLAAADLIDSGDYEDVYAYLFGVPPTTREPEAYSGIYNICGQYDPVAFAPLEAWGFKRNGTDLFTPAQESNPDYPTLAKAASKVSKSLTDKNFRNNPELNYQLRLILEFMREYFPTSEDYAERFQDILMKAWSTEDYEHIDTILKEALSSLETQGTDEKALRDVALDYITYVAAEHTRLQQRQVDDGSWDPEQPLAANIVLEHRPATYVNWLFSSGTQQQLLTGPTTGRRISLTGYIDVEVSKDGTVLGTIDRKGHTTEPEPPENYTGPDLTEPFMMRNGNETIVTLPADEEYRITIHSDSTRSLTYYDVTVDSHHLMGVAGGMRIAALTPDEYVLDIVPGEELPPLIDSDGDTHGLISQEYEYSPSVAMSGELSAVGGNYLTLGSAIRVVIVTVQIILLVLLACLVIFIVHLRGRRKGHPPYSDLYVIVPHLLLIAVFAALTSFSTMYLYTIGGARTICAAVTAGMVFLLALRALIRRRTKFNLLSALVALLFVPLTYAYYSSGMIKEHSMISFIASVAVLIALSVIAVRNFRR